MKSKQKYLYHYFNSNFFKYLVKTRIEGSVIPHLYQRDIEELTIPIPLLGEQEFLIKIFDDFENMLKNLKIC